MINFYSVLAIFLLLAIFINYKYNGLDALLVFSSAVLASGWVYFSALLFLLSITYYFLFQQRIRSLALVSSILLIIVVLTFTFPMQGNSLNYLELGQLFVFIVLLGQLGPRSQNINKTVELLLRGIVIGSLLITAGIYYRYMSGILNQSDFKYLSISNTFNYTSLYLFLGLIVAPFRLQYKRIYKILFLIIFIFATYSLQSRGAFLLGLVFFLVNFSRVLEGGFFKVGIKSLLLISLMVIGVLNSNFFDRRDANDILYSAVDLEKNSSNQERLAMFQASVESVSKFSTGWGVGNSSDALNYFGFIHPHAHNTLAQWLFELGILGFVLMIMLVIYMFRYIPKAKGRRRIFKLTLFVVANAWLVIEAMQYNVILSILLLVHIILLVEGERNLKLS